MEYRKVSLMSKFAGHSKPLLAVAVAVLAACAAQEQAPVQLGPVDGFDLAPTEIERVAVGAMAPDFSLTTMNNDTLTLSDFRGSKNVVLVFYRGHW
jgi:cytochrome oxidase Cu insertion factor (SCO1/SenC/PrrC family)